MSSHLVFVESALNHFLWIKSLGHGEICLKKSDVLIQRHLKKFFFQWIKCGILISLLIGYLWVPNAAATMQMNQRQNRILIKENNAAQLKQTIREMHVQRLKERQIEQQLENQAERKNQLEELRREKRERFFLEKKERWSEKMNSLSPEERQALRKQIKEARIQIYEKTKNNN